MPALRFWHAPSELDLIQGLCKPANYIKTVVFLIRESSSRLGVGRSTAPRRSGMVRRQNNLFDTDAITWVDG